MGMYTQVRGWLNVDSINYEGGKFKKLCNILDQAKFEFQKDKSIDVDRKDVCEDTIMNMGNNGSVYIFFGTELKNYGDPAYEWIKYLIGYFYNAEGRFDFQYEEQKYYNNSESRYILIRGGEIIEDSYCETWCQGYGNMFEKSC